MKSQVERGHFMDIGKVPNDILKNIILDKIRYSRDEVLIRPKIGEDCSALDFGQYACVLSTDPITGAANEIGRIAVHISCNDIASCGVQPLGLMVTILAPPGASEKDLETIMTQICETAADLGVDILGGHTEVTDAVNRFVIMGTAVGKVLKEHMVSTSGAKAGDSIVITKSAGIEGTAIIAHDREEELVKVFGKAVVERAKSFINEVSVVKEGVVAGEFVVNSMHDVTEGGVLGAIWEVAEASEVGVVIYKESIPVEPETLLISRYFGINPYKLISSGSMIITCREGENLVKKLAENSIKATVIGKITEAKERLLIDGSAVEPIKQPESDELYKALASKI